ncbi:MAG: YkgJ family cysteine cluster protein, partial [Candidatus Omnitrophica bacterium]|nr:YkgJ family cysteine cluster protein [Candidatus Omnitrophota bacterium]
MMNSWPLPFLDSLLPGGYCLDCRACCRFQEPHSDWAPPEYTPQKDPAAKPGEACYACPQLDRPSHHCKVYEQRPLDCRLYPFMILRQGEEVSLGID